MNLQPIVVKRVALGVAALGSFLPWVSVGGEFIGGRSFTQGQILTVAAIVGLLVTFSPPADPRARTFDLVIASISVLASVYFYLRYIRGDLSYGSPAYGLFMCIAGSAAWLAWIAWDARHTAHYRRRRPPRRLDDWG